MKNIVDIIQLRHTIQICCLV